MSKKNKFDLTNLVHQGQLKDGQTLYFVSDPGKNCKICKMPNGEFKVTGPDGKPTTVHAFATQCLGMDPPDHATKWLRTESKATLYDLWHADEDYKMAA